MSRTSLFFELDALQWHSFHNRSSQWIFKNNAPKWLLDILKTYGTYNDGIYTYRFSNDKFIVRYENNGSF